MLAETDDFVALATEEMALRQALGRDFVAREPAPGRDADLVGQRGVTRATRTECNEEDAPLSFTIDCRDKTTREINRLLREAIAAGHRSISVIQAPDARHNLGVALLRPVRVVFEGSVGYYCGGMMDGAARRGARQRRLGRGRVDAGRHRGHRRQRRQRRGGVHPRRHRRGARRRGGPGRRVDEGRHPADRRQCGYMAGFMMQKGRIVICGDAGDALADSMYEGVIFVGGKIEALGNDAVIEEPTAEDRGLFARAADGVQCARPGLVQEGGVRAASCGTSTARNWRCGKRPCDPTPRP